MLARMAPAANGSRAALTRRAIVAAPRCTCARTLLAYRATRSSSEPTCGRRSHTPSSRATRSCLSRRRSDGSSVCRSRCSWTVSRTRFTCAPPTHPLSLSAHPPPPSRVLHLQTLLVHRSASRTRRSRVRRTAASRNRVVAVTRLGLSATFARPPRQKSWQRSSRTSACTCAGRKYSFTRPPSRQTHLSQCAAAAVRESVRSQSVPRHMLQKVCHCNKPSTSHLCYRVNYSRMTVNIT